MSKYGMDTNKPKLSSGNPSIGEFGNSGNKKGNKSDSGVQYPHLPSEYEGAKGTKPSGGASGSTTTGNKYPFLPSKPE